MLQPNHTTPKSIVQVAIVVAQSSGIDRLDLVVLTYCQSWKQAEPILARMGFAGKVLRDPVQGGGLTFANSAPWGFESMKKAVSAALEILALDGTVSIRDGSWWFRMGAREYWGGPANQVARNHNGYNTAYTVREALVAGALRLGPQGEPLLIESCPALY